MNTITSVGFKPNEEALITSILRILDGERGGGWQYVPKLDEANVCLINLEDPEASQFWQRLSAQKERKRFVYLVRRQTFWLG